MKRQPTERRGKRKTFTVSCVAWIDLLGYGSMLREVGFDPAHTRAAAAVQRLRTFHAIVAEEADARSPALIVNDGAALFRDLSARSRSVTYDFFRRAVNVYRAVHDAEAAAGHPGPRMVVATGMRMRADGVLRMRSGHLDAILERLQEGRITPTAAIREAFQSRPVVGFVPELQANFAFTKAYLADQGGTKAGLPGPACYVDLNLFDATVPEWVQFERRVAWETPGMSAVFGAFAGLDEAAAGRVNHAGILRADEILSRFGRLAGAD